MNKNDYSTDNKMPYDQPTVRHFPIFRKSYNDVS